MRAKGLQLYIIVKVAIIVGFGHEINEISLDPFYGRRGKPNIDKHRFGAVTLAEQRLQGLSIPKSGDDPDAVDILIILYYL